MFLFEGLCPERQKPRARPAGKFRQEFYRKARPCCCDTTKRLCLVFLLNIKTESRQTDPAGRRYTPHRLTLFPVRLFRPLHLVSAATPPRTTKFPTISPAWPNVSRAAPPAFFAYFNLSAPPKYLSAKWYNITILITVGEYFL